jgi:predicted dithiol-disulfide oxidoreductase (DUF899 family)
MATIVSPKEWLEARKKLLEQEKEFARLRDSMAELRRALPWEKVTKDYLFTTQDGQQSLAGLFAGKSQLIIYHFMFGPDWDEGCPSCSFWADNYNGIDIHLAHRDTTLIAVSQAPLEKLLAYRERMNWSFNWASSESSDFNFDFHVSFTPDDLDGDVEYNYRKSTFPASEAPGLSVFHKKKDDIFHTYSTYARGLDAINSAYQLLDLTPKGRDEDTLDFSMGWLRRHDQYGD